MRQIRNTDYIYAMRQQQRRDNDRTERFAGIILCAGLLAVAAMVVIDLWF